jgi:CRP/FNR family transcriptional regulator, cyclic AMP receptor protein
MVAINLFRHDAQAITVPAGQLIFDVGSPPDCMYGVIDGAVDVVAHGVVLETVGAGGIVGELALIDSTPHSAAAVAKTECRVSRVDQKRFEWLVAEHPTFALTVMKIMAERLRRASGTN